MPLNYKPLDPTHFNFTEDFETANFAARWSWRDLPYPTSMAQTKEQIREGLFSCKVVLNKTDPLVSGNHRAELVWNSIAYRQQTNTKCQFICYSVFVPLGWADDTNHPESIINIHDGEPCENHATNPQALLIQTMADGKSHFTYWINKMNDKDYCAGGTIQRVATIDLGVVEKGRWYDFVVESNWDWQNTGFVNVWKDGVKMASYKGPCWFKGCFTEPYIKIGLYKFSWTNETAWGGYSKTTQRVFYIDRVRFGNSLTSLDDVLPILEPVNHPPTIDPISDQIFTLPVATATISATVSDVDNDKLIFEWKDDAGNVVSRMQQFTHQFDEAGTYNYHLSVSDGKAVVSALARVIINPIPPKLIMKVESILNPKTGGLMVTHYYADGTTQIYQ